MPNNCYNLIKIEGSTYGTDSEGRGLFIKTQLGWMELFGPFEFSVEGVKDKKGKVRRFVKRIFYKEVL